MNGPPTIRLIHTNFANNALYEDYLKTLTQDEINAIYNTLMTHQFKFQQYLETRMRHQDLYNAGLHNYARRH